MAFDLLIRGGTVATAADTFAADIAVMGGTIVQIGRDLGDAHRVVDASSKLVLPGGIDSHVHIAQPSGPGIVMADDFESATRSALFGGNTTVMPFCLQERDHSLRDALTGYHAMAQGKCYTDVSFHLIVSDPTPAVLGQELPALIADGYTSVKVFMTYEGLRLNDAQILSTMAAARQSGAVVMVHAENEDVIRFLVDRHEQAGDTGARAHATTRPVAAEREATHRAISLAEVTEVPLVIVHVSNGATIDEIAAPAPGARRSWPRPARNTCELLVLHPLRLHRSGPRRRILSSS
jgi:dihydropyrimidinase